MKRTPTTHPTTGTLPRTVTGEVDKVKAGQALTAWAYDDLSNLGGGCIDMGGGCIAA